MSDEADASREQALALLSAAEQEELNKRPIGSDEAARGFSAESLAVRRSAAAKYETKFINVTDDAHLSDELRAIYAAAPRYRFYTRRGATADEAIRVFGATFVPAQPPEREAAHRAVQAVAVRADGGLCEFLGGVALDELVALEEWTDAQLASISKAERPEIFLDPFGWILCVK